MLENNRLKKVRKMFFNKHINIVTKNGGKKSEKIFLQETHVYREQKTMEKKSGKSAKTRFFINTRISWPKNGEKKREKNFSRNTRISRVINDGKKNRLEKVRNNVFYKHLNIVTKNGEKSEKNFLPETNVYREQKRWKKFVWKKCENTFFL